MRHLLAAEEDWHNRQTWRFLTYPDVDTSVDDRDKRLRSQFVVLPLTEVAAKGGLFREIDRKAPASTDPKRAGHGARDATIWLTTLEQCATASPTTVFLVSNDGDFGARTLRPELVDEAPSNLTYCHGLDALLRHLADQDDTAEAEARKVMETSNVSQALHPVLADRRVFDEVYDAPPAAMYDLRQPASGENVHLEDPRKIHGYRKGDNLFATGELWWRIVRRHQAADSDGSLVPVEVRFWMKVTVLVIMRPDGAIRGIRIIHRKPITRVEVEELA